MSTGNMVSGSPYAFLGLAPPSVQKTLQDLSLVPLDDSASVQKTLPHPGGESDPFICKYA